VAIAALQGTRYAIRARAALAMVERWKLAYQVILPTAFIAVIIYWPIYGWLAS